MKKLLYSVFVMMFLAGTLSAQQADVASLKKSTARVQNGLGISPAASPFSLLDLSRIKWSHSYSVSFLSGGGSSGSIGLWNTTMNYEISSKLRLAVNLGMLHTPFGSSSGGQQGTDFLPGFRLDYQPSENVLMTLSVQKYVGYYSPYSGRYYRGYR